MASANLACWRFNSSGATSIAWLWGLVILFLTAAFYIHSIHTTHMREDEEIAYRSTQYDLAYAVRFQAERDVHAPLWFASFWLWQQFMGDSEFMGRVYSIFLSMITMALVYQMGKRWFGAPRYGLFAMAVLGVNAYFLIYSLEIRPYAMVMLAAAVSMWRFWRWLRLKTWRAALWYGVSLAVMLYIHYFLIFLIAVQVVYFCMVQRPTAKTIRQSVGAGVLMLALWLPWLPIFIKQIQTLQQIEATGSIGIANTTEPTTLAAIVELANAVTNGQPGLYALTLLAGSLAFLRRGAPLNISCSARPRSAYILALLWGIGVPAIAFILNLFASVYTQRYVTYLVVGLALALGAGLAVCGKLLNRHPAKNAGHGDARFAKNISVIALLGFAAVSLWALPSQLPRDRIPYRDLLRSLSAAARPGDVVFFDHADTDDNFAQWQYRHYLLSELWANAVFSPEAVPEARRIWHVTAHLFDPDVIKNFAALEATHPRQTGFGECNRDWCYVIQLMEAPPWTEPVVFGENMAFWGVDVDSVSREALQTRLWWRVEQRPDLDYSISLQLLDSSGALVAQRDGPINQFGVRVFETSQLEPGQIYIDHRTLALPADLSAGEYALALVVYQSWDGVRLRLPDGRDQLILDFITIP